MQWHAVSIKQRRLARLTPCLLFGVMSLGGCRHQDKSLVVLVHGSIQVGAVLGRAELYQYSAGRADQRSADGVSLPLGDERGGQLARDRTIVERAGIDTT